MYASDRAVRPLCGPRARFDGRRHLPFARVVFAGRIGCRHQKRTLHIVCDYVRIPLLLNAKSFDAIGSVMLLAIAIQCDVLVGWLVGWSPVVAQPRRNRGAFPTDRNSFQCSVLWEFDRIVCRGGFTCTTFWPPPADLPLQPVPPNSRLKKINYKTRKLLRTDHSIFNFLHAGGVSRSFVRDGQ